MRYLQKYRLLFSKTHTYCIKCFRIHRILFITVFIHFMSCSKEDNCDVIRDKAKVNGFYYFYFRANNTISSQGGTLGRMIDMENLSGKVSWQVYEQYEVGDEYCF